MFSRQFSLHYRLPLLVLLIVGAFCSIAPRAAAQLPVTDRMRDTIRAQITELEPLHGPPTGAPLSAPAECLQRGLFAGASAADTPVHGSRGAVELYRNLQPVFAENGFWHRGNTVYWALDDGIMGPAGLLAGGAHITAYQFGFGMNSDGPGDIIRPAIIVSFYNAPNDPVGTATNPVVEPPAPVSSILWIADSPYVFGSAGFFADFTGPLDLSALDLDFDLDASFYVEILVGEWNALEDLFILDPDAFAVFTGPDALTYGTNADVFWSDRFITSPAFSPGDGDSLYDHPAEMDTGGHPTQLRRSPIALFGLPCPAQNQLVLTLTEPDAVCVLPGENVTVTLAQTCLPQLVRGYQAFLAFDPVAMTFISGTYTTMPYGLPVIDPITATPAGEINVAAGINNLIGQPLTSSSADLATFSFVTGPGEGLAQLVFRPHDPPTRFSDSVGGPVVPTLFDSLSVCVDATPPSITCGDLNLQCLSDVPDPAADLAEFEAQGGVATDSGCGPGVTIDFLGESSSGTGCAADPYIVLRDYRATDCAGNFADCLQAITVIDDTAPDITCPPDLTVECDASTDPADTGEASATDNCGGSPVITYGDVEAPGACPHEKTITRTWTATDDCGNESMCVQTITVDDSVAPVLACPADVAIDCSEFALVYNLPPGVILGTSAGGVAVYYNDNGGGENPANQAYLRAQAAYANTNGGVFNFDPTPLPPYNLFSWYDLFQVLPDQFGLDLILPAPTWDGSVAIPTFVAKDNVNASCAGAASAGSHTWAISGYIPTPADPGGCVVNSLFRSAGLNPASVVLTQYDLSLSGTVYTADVAGYLVTDFLIHWYTVVTPDSPASNFGLTGVFFFDGSLTYDAAGDPGTDLIDFYEGTMTIYANSPITSVGVPTVTDNCDPLPAVTFADVFDDDPPGCYTGTIIRTWTATDACGNVGQCVQNIAVQDNQAPSLAIPADITVHAEAGTCAANLDPGLATATDDCDAAPDVTFVRSDGKPNLTDPYDAADSPITITWTAADCAGNITIDVQTITVHNTSLMDVSLSLAGVVSSGPFDRCITFELRDCPGGAPTIVEATLSFTAGAASDTIEVPCGAYSCITARDRLHSLRRTLDNPDFQISGTSYVADFDAAAKPLVLGNLDDSSFIDILDFGALSAQYAMPLAVDTPCGTAAPHADVTGNGVVFTEDFVFIANNFLDESDPDCCAAPFAAPPDQPTVSIAVAELIRRGLGHLAAGDLNRDGVLDVQDIVAFTQGARPNLRPRPRPLAQDGLAPTGLPPGP